MAEFGKDYDKDKFKKLVASFGDKDSPQQGGPRELTEEERLKLEEEQNKGKQRRGLANKRSKGTILPRTPALRMETWLKGINTDISKVAAALQEANSCKDPDQTHMYIKRFKDSQEGLQTYRSLFEKAPVRNAIPEKSEMAEAEKKVSEAKTSLSAWSKLKSLLM